MLFLDSNISCNFAHRGYEPRSWSVRKIFTNLMFYLCGNKFFASRHQAFDAFNKKKKSWHDIFPYLIGLNSKLFWESLL